MRKKSMVINDIEFELQNTTVPYTSTPARSLNMCYGKPSLDKQNIYDFWYKWFEKMGTKPIEHGISRYNLNRFTYAGYFIYNDKMYFAVITQYHNRLYEVA